MKKLFSLCLLLISFLCGIIVSAQTDPMNLPKLTEYVTDFSNVLTADQLSELRGIAKAYEDKTSTQIVSVLFPNRNGNELFDIGMKIGEENEIGQKKLNNGLLLVIATEEKKIRIMVGYGLEGSIPDALASNIIEQDIRPYVNEGDIYNAVKGFYTRSISAIDNDESVNFQGDGGSSSSSDDNTESGLFFLGFIVGMLLTNIPYIKKHIDKNKLSKKYKTLSQAMSVILSFVVFFAFGTIGLFFFAGLSMLIVGSMLGFVFGIIGLLGTPGSGRSGGFWFGGGGSGGGSDFGGGGFSGGGGSFGGGGAGD